MIKLERGDKMNKAIERAKAVRPFVKWLGGRTYTVTSRDGLRVYTVRFVVANGHKLAECNCKAGVEGMLCYHIAASAGVNIGIASMRQRAASPLPQAEAVNPRAASVHPPTEQPSNIPAAAHAHKCSGCPAEIKCDFPYCSGMSELIFCPACYGAGRRIDEVVPTVYPPTVSNGAHARAC